MGVQYNRLSRRIKIAGGRWSGHFIVAMWRTFANVTWNIVSCRSGNDGDENGAKGSDVVTFHIVESGCHVVLAIREPHPWNNELHLRVVDGERQHDVAREVFDRACIQMCESVDRERTITAT